MAYKIAVIVREVWDTRDLPEDIVDGAGRLKVPLLATRFEPEDLNALEMALKIRDAQGGGVTALAVAPVRGLDVLRECLYRGVDEVVSLPAEHLSDYDTSASAHLYAAAIRKLGAFDLIFAGITMAEGENALIGASVARLLGMEHISYVDAVEKVADGAIVARRAVEMGYELIEARLPAIINVGVALLQEDPRTPRSAKATLKLKLKKTPIPQWGPAQLGIDETVNRQTAQFVGYTPVEQKVVHACKVDPQSLAELRAMLNDVWKGI